MKSIAIRVKGRVQGVYYRQSTREKARALGLTGLVRNEPDGTVYLEASGEEELLQALINWCKTGPVLARVTGLEITDLEPRFYSSFDIDR